MAFEGLAVGQSQRVFCARPRLGIARMGKSVSRVPFLCSLQVNERTMLRPEFGLGAKRKKRLKSKYYVHVVIRFCTMFRKDKTWSVRWELDWVADRGSEAEGTGRCFLIVRFLGKQ